MAQFSGCEHSKIPQNGAATTFYQGKLAQIGGFLPQNGAKTLTKWRNLSLDSVTNWRKLAQLATQTGTA